MRQQLNENPRVQMIVLGVVGVIAAILLFTTVLKKEPAADPPLDSAANPTAPLDSGTASGAPEADTATTDPAAASGADEAAAPAATTPADPAVPPADPAATTPVAPTDPAAPGAADGLLPSKGLPKEVLVAYANNKAIALLVVDPKGLSDQRLESFTDALRSSDQVAFFLVKSRNIADYSRITSGVSVNRVPALVVIRPRKLNEGAPTATVSYGFRSPKSVTQAVRDMLYEGKPVTAYP